VWILLFGLSSLISLAFAPKTDPHGIYTLVQMIILIWLIGQLATTRTRIELLMIVWILIMVVTEVIGMAGFDFSTLGRENRLEGLAVNANEMAFYSIMGICFILYFLLNARTVWSRMLWTAALAVGALGVLLSASRGGIIVLLAVVLYSLLSLRSKLLRGLRLGGILLIVIATFILLTRLNLSFVPSLIAGVPQTLTSAAEGGSDEARVAINRNGLQTWSKYPIFGVGLGCGMLVDAYGLDGSGLPVASHCSYVTVLVDAGAVGFALFCMLLLTTWLNLSQRPPREQTFLRRNVDLNWSWRGAFLGLLIMSLTGDFFSNVKIFWIIIGVSIVLRRMGGPSDLRRGRSFPESRVEVP
jgi:O-antigen ligase